MKKIAAVLLLLVPLVVLADLPSPVQRIHRIGLRAQLPGAFYGESVMSEPCDVLGY